MLGQVEAATVAFEGGDEYSVFAVYAPQLRCRTPCELVLPVQRLTLGVHGAASYETTVTIPGPGRWHAQVSHRRWGFSVLGVAAIVGGVVLTLVAASYANEDGSVAVGAGLTGLLVGAVGAPLAFRLAGGNRIELTPVDATSRASVRVAGVGIAPVHNGAVAGAVLRF